MTVQHLAGIGERLNAASAAFSVFGQLRTIASLMTVLCIIEKAAIG
jgi:hypothetical protein